MQMKRQPKPDLAGFNIQEIPVWYSARTLREGKEIRAKDGFYVLWTLPKLRFSSYR